MSEMTPEERMLRAIFGENTRSGRETQEDFSRALDPLAPQLLTWVMEAVTDCAPCTRAQLIAHLTPQDRGDGDAFNRFLADLCRHLIQVCLAELALRGLVALDRDGVALAVPKSRIGYHEDGPRLKRDLQAEIGANLRGGLPEDAAIEIRPGVADPPDAFTQALQDLERPGAISHRTGGDVVHEAPRKALEGKHERGWLAENIPRSMRVRIPEKVEIRISRTQRLQLMDHMIGRGAPEVRGIPVTEAMSLKLTAPNGGFVVDALSPETQWVSSPSAVDEEFASWQFTVTPTRRGIGLLRIALSYKQVGAGGLVANKSLPDQTIDVRVRANVGKASVGVAAWVLTLLAGAAAGSYFQDALSWFAISFK